MANGEVGRKATGVAIGTFRGFFLLVYLHLVTSREISDDATEEHPPSPPSGPEPESLTVQIPDLENQPTIADTRSAPSVEQPTPKPSPAQDNGGGGHPPEHPIIRIMWDQELGKATLAFAVAIAMELINSGKEKVGTAAMTPILIALSAGSAAIWNGIMLRKMFPKAAVALEQLGIGLVFLSFNVLIAVPLPVEFCWAPGICMGMFLLPFIIAAIGQPPP